MTKQLIKALQNFDKTSSGIALVDQEPISDRCSNLYKMHELAKEGLSYGYFLLACKELQWRRIIAHLLDFDYKNEFLGANTRHLSGYYPRVVRDFFHARLNKNPSLHDHMRNLQLIHSDGALSKLCQLEGSTVDLGNPYLAMQLSYGQHALAAYYFVHQQSKSAFLIIGNQGQQDHETTPKYQSGIYIYQVHNDPSHENIKSLLTKAPCLRVSVERFYQLFDEIIVPHATQKHYHSMPPQKSGNCCWASVELLVRMHIAVEQSRQQDQPTWQSLFNTTASIYDDFMHALKRDILKEYLTSQDNHRKQDRPELCDEKFLSCILAQIEYYPEYLFLKQDTFISTHLDKFSHPLNHEVISQFISENEFASGRCERHFQDAREDHNLSRVYIEKYKRFISQNDSFNEFFCNAFYAFSTLSIAALVMLSLKQSTKLIWKLTFSAISLVGGPMISLPLVRLAYRISPKPQPPIRPAPNYKYPVLESTVQELSSLPLSKSFF
ncbi:MAG: hypothetical protein VYC40_02080 [Pseudomonadota bacterium]|nr:hypothetical protein [Pseudomonadota bacterium]